MKSKSLLVSMLVIVLIASFFTVAAADGCGPGNSGGDGYIDNANIFVGDADCVDHTLDGTVWGDSMYANDLLVMKSSESWDDPLDPGTWLNNNWNGMAPGGSGETWHYKIDAHAGCTGDNCIWGNYEVLQSHGTAGGHIWDVKQPKGGYGVQR